MIAEMLGERKFTENNCQFCIDFVTNSTLKLQEFDFDIKDLDQTDISGRSLI
jgi:hypothetical protein